MIYLTIDKSRILKMLLDCNHPNIKSTDLQISETKCVELYCPDCFLEYRAYDNMSFNDVEKQWREILSNERVTILINE